MLQVSICLLLPVFLGLKISGHALLVQVISSDDGF